MLLRLRSSKKQMFLDLSGLDFQADDTAFNSLLSTAVTAFAYCTEDAERKLACISQ